jgi:hypothetical protein
MLQATNTFLVSMSAADALTTLHQQACPYFTSTCMLMYANNCFLRYMPTSCSTTCSCACSCAVRIALAWLPVWSPMRAAFPPHHQQVSVMPTQGTCHYSSSSCTAIILPAAAPV